ncbi:MAG: sigma 54-interacting transcriptional regulator [Deltaproteobacteria bacterium]|nr:sigma 54-interacting transcriptional regulator [Deltaproteobacteria bacterium]
MGETWSEPPARSGQGEVRVLACVLSYDDLLADVAAWFRLGAAALPLSIGRGDGPRAALVGAELRLPDRWMSGGHALLRSSGAVDVLADLGSRNGTWVNGARVAAHALSDGDLIEVGHTLLCYRRVPEAALSALEQASASAARLGPTRTVSPAVAVLLRDLGRIAPSREPVLIQGETGAGKEMVAETLHRLSARSGALCAVDCGAVPETLFETTFFGHQRGAFTGAQSARDGEIVRADRGTLLLDEVGNLSPAGQAKLLRVLEEGRVTPLGGEVATTVDVRWAAATNRELLGGAGGAGFREDLVARLAGYVARVPALRERREDLGILAAHLLAQAGIERASINVAAARVLFNHRLPGNVRQLRAALRSAALLAAGEAIDVAQLPAHLLRPAGAEAEPEAEHEQEVEPGAGARGGAGRKGAPTASELEAALLAAQGNVVRAAESFGTSARQLYRWLQRHGVDIERFRG